MLRAGLTICIFALVLPAFARAAEVIDLRLGYWEMVMESPGQKTRTDRRCLTPEDLEYLRFFMTEEEGCRLEPKSQTRTSIEAKMICRGDDEEYSFDVALNASSPTNFVMTFLAESEGKTATGSITGRWLQESCDVFQGPGA